MIQARSAASVGFGAALPGTTTGIVPPPPGATFQLDTGSIGTALPLTSIGADAIGPGPTAYKYYDSSGNEFAGYIYLAPVAVTTSTGTVVSTPMLVLGVASSACHPKSKCTTPPGFASFDYLGVGFARATGAPGDPFTSPADNALLSMRSSPSGAMSPGYSLSGSQITIGTLPEGE